MCAAAGPCYPKTRKRPLSLVSVHRFDLQKHAEHAAAPACSSDGSPDTPRDPAAILRNVILLHLRDWSVRAIAEDLDVPRSTVQDMIDRWRSSPASRAG